MAADPIWASVNADGTFVSPKIQSVIDARTKDVIAPLLDGKRGVEARELGTEHLDTVTTPDVYSQSADIEATLENGYPVTRGGVLEVERSASKKMVWQTYTTYAPSPSVPPQTWRRGSYNGVWSAWARVDGSNADVVAAADRAEAVARSLDGLKEAVDSTVAQSPADSAVAAVIGQEGTQARATVMGVASHVTATSLAGHTAVSEARAATTSDLYARLRLTPDGRTRTTLFTGQPGPVYAVPTHARTEDRVRVMEGETAQRVTAVSAGTLSISTSYDPPKTFPPASVVRALVWLDDAAVVSSLSVNIRQQTSPTVIQWSRSHVSAGHTLTSGWNLISWVASSGVTTAWGQCTRVEVVASTTAATSITVQSVWVESPPKAQILFIDDRGYKTFVDRGLPDLRARGIPVTWALDPMLNGSNVGTKAEAITDAQVAQFYAAGDDISIHAYAGERTALMSREQIRQDALLSHQWLQDRGYVRGRQWRAAWTQNDAPHHAAARPYYAAYATPNSGASLTAWPFPTPWNVPRVNLQGSDSSRIDEFFQTLQRTNGLMVCYTHGIHEDGGADMTPTQWAYLMQKIDAAKAEGWLEGVTFSQLLERSSGLMR